VEVGPKVVRVNGLEVVTGQAKQSFFVFECLWQSFLDDLAKGMVPEKYRATSMKSFADKLEEQSGSAVDEISVRRLLNRLQIDIEARIKTELGRI